MITRVTKDWTAGTETVESLFVGATLALHWNSTRVMSDVWENCPYATVYDAADGAVKIVWRDGKGPAEVDATADTIAAANAWLLKTAADRRKASWDARVAKAVDAAHKPAKGKTVTVVKGRKVPKGTTGEVIWVGAGKAYGYYDRPSDRLGVKDAAGTVHWTAASNVEVVNADDYFDYDEFVTNEPDHTALATAALDSGKGYADVVLSAGEDRLGFSNWFTAAAVAAAA